MTKAVGYVRPPQGPGIDPGPDADTPGAVSGPDAQRGRIWAWCKAHGHTLDDIHAEADAPAGDRPALAAALSAAAGGILVVDGVASLAVSVADLARIAARLRDTGARLVALTDGIDTASDPDGVAVRLLQAAARLTAPPVAEAAPPFRFAAETVADLADIPPPAAPDVGLLADADPELDAAPTWGDLPLDAGVGGFASAGEAEEEPAAEPAAVPGIDATPPEMRVPLGDLGVSEPEADADGIEGAEAAASEASSEAAPVHRTLQGVSPVRDDIVPVDERDADDAPAAAMPAAEPTAFTTKTGGPRAKHRRESDYAATAEKASRHLQKGKLDKAAAIWTHFLRGAEGNNAGRAWNHLGDIHARSRRNVAAADAWLRAAESFESARYPHMAVATLKKVIKLDPGRPEIYRSLAELNARCDRVGDAVDAYLRYARYLKEQERLAEALEIFGHIRILDPVNARHRMQLADELLGFGFEGEAAREAVHAADLLLERGDHDAAAEHLKHWCGRIPGHAGLALRLTAMAGGGTPPRVPPAVGIPGGVLLTTGGSGRSRSSDPGWSRGSGGG